MQKYHILDYLDKLVLVCGLECTYSQNKEKIESGVFHSIQEWFIVHISLNIPPPPLPFHSFFNFTTIKVSVTLSGKTVPAFFPISILLNLN